MRYPTPRKLTHCLIAVLAVLILLPNLASSAFDTTSVCSDGTGVPPFLSSGAKPNLLMVLDNSGSMLDMAYNDPDDSQCFDDSYSSAQLYGGAFESDDTDHIWYTWVSGPYNQWQNATEYGDTGEPTRVYVNGIIYEVEAACTSSGTFLENDSGCEWNKLVYTDIWQQGYVYDPGDFIIDRKQLYLTRAGCTSSSGSEITDDTNCTWEAVDHTWRDDIAYALGDIVTYYGKYYEAGGAVAINADAPDINPSWTYLVEGYFEKIGAGVADVSTYCGGTAEYMDSMCVRVDTTTTPATMLGFVARGNFLNWATASKFDIQKSILTGGKYDENNSFVMSENRGCAGKGYVKEVPLLSAGGHLTFRVRGSFTEDGEPYTWDYVDTTDDTTRLEILGFSSSGFDMESCQDAIDKIINVGSGFQNDVDNCLSGGGNDVRDALNHALQYCWQDNHVRNLKTIADDCEGLYGSLPPTGITAYNDAYNCYGVYDDSYDHTNRTGYVGRCWDLGTGSGTSTCDPYPRDTADCDWFSTDPCTFQPGGANTDLFRNSSSSNYTEICTNLKNNGVQCQNSNAWEVYYTDSVSTAQCDPSDAAYGGTGAEWTDLLYPNNIPTNDHTDDPEYAVFLADGYSIPNNPGIGDGTDAEWWCMYQAMEDYCGDLTVPEVIDPTDLATTTNEYWNIPGNLIDSGVFSQLGIDHPLITMKAVIFETTAPTGLLDSVADKVRIGAMAFNDNGAEAECTTAAAAGTGAIDKYCPSTNLDGARIISGIKNGGDIVSGTTTHLDDLKTSINAIRATSWTPLSEALYNALGYYGQNSGFRINASDFGISASDDPVEFWCQDNNILVITEGASTADMHTDVLNKINTLAASGISDDDATVEGECMLGADHELFGSTYLDDITYFGQNAQDAGVYAVPTMTTVDGDVEPKKDIRTYMVVAGSPRDEATGTRAECNPNQLMTNAAVNGGSDELYVGEDPEALEQQLLEVISDILSRVSAGSAASVISSSRSGEGAVYQAIFWPETTRAADEDPLLWVGDVHSFFIDEHGQLWDDYSINPITATLGEGVLWSEDLNGNGILDAGEDTNNNGTLDGDRRIVTFYSATDSATLICFNPLVQETGTCVASDYTNTPVTEPLRDFDDYLWSAKDNLEDLVDYSTNRDVLVGSGEWDFADNRRYIFTWNDLDNDGIVDQDLFDGIVGVDSDGVGNTDRNEVLHFTNGMSSLTEVTDSAADGSIPTRQSLVADFDLTTAAELDGLIDWMRGGNTYETDVNNDGVLDASEDLNGNGERDWEYRCRRTICDPDDTDYLDLTINRKYLLGDVIHSTPTLVGRPAEGYQFIYQDTSYAQFYKQYLQRRHVIYFGGNDGMLHAVNGGFYVSGLNKFLPCRADQRNPATGECNATTPYATDYLDAYPALGDELWAYVPYNLQPHLSCLSDHDYDHKYFVDAPPRVFDARIFPDDAIHTQGWGTILVGYMRFGGAPEEALDGGSYNRIFKSTYFILDITDPERPPTLLAELTVNDDTEDYDGDFVAEDKWVDVGYTTSMPTMVVMRDDAGFSEWFLVLGSGPDTLAAENSQQGKVSIVPLNSITGVNWHLDNTGSYTASDRQAFRIPNREPLPDSSTDPTRHFGRYMLPADSNGDIESFTGDLVTVDADINTNKVAQSSTLVPYKSDVVYFGTVDGSGFDVGGTYWDGDGRLFRLVMRSLGVNGSGQTIQEYNYPADWDLLKMIDAQGPVTAAPNVGYDGDNFWVYFGTGRFYDANDKTDDATQYFFGLKEPYNANCEFTWDDIEWMSGGLPISTDPTQPPGQQGLLRTDPMRIIDRDTNGYFSSVSDYFYCEYDNGTQCPTLPAAIDQVSFDISTDPNTPLGTDTEHTYYSFNKLVDYIKGERCIAADDDTIGIDGWYRHFRNPRERSLGMPTLLGGLTTFTSYQPYADLCKPEGDAYLFATYYLTGTAWTQAVLGESEPNDDTNTKHIVLDSLFLGSGLATTPSLQVGTGPDDATAFIQTSTGEIVEVGQETLPINNTTSGRTSWRMK